MHIVIAPDSYKGSLSALEVASAMETGILRVFPDAEICKVPIADGGEGTVQALICAAGGAIIEEWVSGPLGEPVRAGWGILGDGETAVIEMAAASGLGLVPQDKRDPRITTSYGTGSLIKAALDRGLRKIVLGIGGSATNDGGAGLAQALGIRFFDSNGKGLVQGGAALADLAEIDLRGIDPRLQDTEITVACDVKNPLCGPQGASAVYGPQKGADPETVRELDAALMNFAEAACKATGKDVADRAGAGAAGGLGAGLMYFTDAVLRPGIDVVIEVTKLDELIQTADLVITGEGCTDSQTVFGKAPTGVASAAKRCKKPVVCLSGSLGHGVEEVLGHGIDVIMSVVPRPMTMQECMETAEQLVSAAAEQLARSIRMGMSLRT